MFEGGGFGVGVTVSTLAVDPWPEVLPAGVTARPTRLGELMPVAARSDAEIAVELQRVQQMEARLAAYTAELVTELALRRPDAADRQLGEPGAASPDWAPGPGNEPVAGVSEFFPDELAQILRTSRNAATTLAQTGHLLVTQLTGTWAALADGVLDRSRGWAIAAELTEPARELEPGLIAAVEAAVLPRAGELSVSRLRTAVREELLRVDPTAADRRRRRAQACANVTVRPRRDGMAELSVFAPQPLAAALADTADRLARQAKTDGDARPIGQLRVAALADLVLRPWDNSRPPVTAHLDVIAPAGTLTAAAAGHDACTVDHHGAGATPAGGCCGGAAPAEVNGQPITAGQLRELLEWLDALCPGGLQAPAGGTLGISLTDPATGALRAVVTHGELARLARRGCTDHPAGDCGCPVLDRPAATDRYRPPAGQRRFLTSRDRTCRQPGCGNRAGWADVDHVVPHADGGATACENLCCLCRRHHRLKTWASGWRFAMDADGVLTVTTPSGVTRTTRPPGMTWPRLDDPVFAGLHPPGTHVADNADDADNAHVADNAGDADSGDSADNADDADDDPPPF